ncbi:MAG: hypothetical protein ACKPGF_00990, partial [Microcystis panniformis]
DIYQKSHEQARGLKTERVPIIFINKYFTQFIPGKQESYATTTESLPTSALIRFLGGATPIMLASISPWNSPVFTNRSYCEC